METTAAATHALHQLLTDEWEFRLREDPLFATLAGDHRYDDRLPHVTEADDARRLETLRAFRERARAIEPSALPEAERLNHAIFVRLLDNDLGELEHHAYRLPLSKVGGLHTFFPELHQFMPLNTAADYANYVARLAAFGACVTEHIELLRGALDTGYVPARATLEGLADSLRPHVVEAPEQSQLYAPLGNFPAGLSTADQAQLLAAGREAIAGSVVPGFKALLDFVEQEYVPGAREDVAAANLPNGGAFYQHRLRYYTSLDLTPEQVHATGLAEVARLRAEMQALITSTGFAGGFQDFVDFLRTDARFYAATPEALLKEVGYLMKRVDGELPRLFKTLPRLPYGIRAIPDFAAPGNTTAYYFPPAGDGTRAGMYYVNTYDLPSRPLYEVEALSLHEAVPGHHLQIALQQELDLPNFRRFGGFTAFVEGWALYAERLGLELGFYTDPYSNFGRLSYEMWRACRLVVDPGLHALGWTRQQAIDYMAANTASTLLNITNEVDRYIAWPGQAVAYKIGELKIRELRAYAEETLGARFDLRDFHDLLLGSGAVPLDVLEAMVRAWVADNGAL